MVGLSVVLEGNKDITKKAPQVISKASMNMIKPPSPAAASSSSPSSSTPSSTFNNPFSRRSSCSSNPSSCFPAAGFLDHCFLCKEKLLPGRDIYMYKGDRAFCSEECRYRQIFMDEEETTTVKAKPDHYCSFAAIQPQKTSTSPSSSRYRKGARNQANGFAC